MTKRIVLISGSRDASAELLERVRGAVGRVWWNKDELIVGDASGVDAQVVRIAEQCQMPFMAYGIAQSARNRARYYTNIRSRLNKKYAAFTTILYRRRDEWMVQQADVVLCFWNERSPGTKHVFEYACEQGKAAYLIGQHGLIESNQPRAKVATLAPQVSTGSFERVL